MASTCTGPLIPFHMTPSHLFESTTARRGIGLLLCILALRRGQLHHLSVSAFGIVGSAPRTVVPKSFYTRSKKIPVIPSQCSERRASPLSVPRRSLAVRLRLSSDWASFSAMDDDDDDNDIVGAVDRTSYALEEDAPNVKAKVGASLEPPTILQPADPIFVPPGSALELSEEVVLGVLSACREELGTLFGYTAENRGVGITGGVDYSGLDGPTVVLSLKGRYWHQRTAVLERVGNYLQQRIPEIVDVTVEDPYQLTDEANEVW